MKKRNSILSSAISVALLSAFLGGCSGDNPESLIASSKEFLAKNDSKAAVIQLFELLVVIDGVRICRIWPLCPFLIG